MGYVVFGLIWIGVGPLERMNSTTCGPNEETVVTLNERWGEQMRVDAYDLGWRHDGRKSEEWFCLRALCLGWGQIKRTRGRCSKILL